MRALPKRPILAVLLGLLLAGCAPSTMGPPPSKDAYQVSPYEATPRSAEPGGDGLFAIMGSDGLTIGLQRSPWRGELVGVGGSAGGTKLKGAWVKDQYAVQAEVAYLFYTNWAYAGGQAVDVNHRIFGLAVDASYLWPVPVAHGSAYAGPRARAYWSVEKINNGPYRSASAGLLPGVVMGVNLPVPITQDRLVFGLEASLFVVSPWLTSEADWSLFSPFSLSLSYRF